MVGRAPDAAPNLPAALVASIIREKASAAVGLVRARGLVFIEPGVRIRGKRHISFGRGVSIGRRSVIDGYAVNE